MAAFIVANFVASAAEFLFVKSVTGFNLPASAHHRAGAPSSPRRWLACDGASRPARVSAP